MIVYLEPTAIIKRYTQERGSEAASEIKNKVGNKIDELADTSRSVAHDAGAKLEQSGRRLQDA